MQTELYYSKNRQQSNSKHFFKHFNSKKLCQSNYLNNGRVKLGLALFLRLSQFELTFEREKSQSYCHWDHKIKELLRSKIDILYKLIRYLTESEICSL